MWLRNLYFTTRLAVYRAVEISKNGMEMDSEDGMTAEFMTANGGMTKCKGEENSNSQTAPFMNENLIIIR